MNHCHLLNKFPTLQICLLFIKIMDKFVTIILDQIQQTIIFIIPIGKINKKMIIKIILKYEKVCIKIKLQK